MGMTSSEGRVAPIEGVLEQMNERMGILEAQNLRILEPKADTSEVRLLFVTGYYLACRLSPSSAS
jgi:C4-type Zn-finger protein